MVVDNAQRLLGRHLYVCSLFAVRIDDLDNRLVLADADAARLRDHDIGKLALCDLIDDRGEHGSCARGDAAGRHADEHAGLGLGVLADIDRGSRFISNCLKFS